VGGGDYQRTAQHQPGGPGYTLCLTLQTWMALPRTYAPKSFRLRVTYVGKYPYHLKVQVYEGTSGVHLNSGNTYTKGAQIRKIARERSKNFVLEQMYFSMSNDNAMALKYIDSRHSALRPLRKVKSCLKMTK
jgi:hypothetical protein